MLIKVIAGNDSNNEILRYLLTIEGPSYISARYWDWIEPYVEDSIKKGVNSVDQMVRLTSI
jgi:hypothetical protein